MPTDTQEIQEDIRRLKEERNAILLVHNYQPAEIQDIADILGDSLELARAAAAKDGDASVFCGVDFMAETAAILSPKKPVILPAGDSCCPMADMITAEELKQARAEHPNAAVVCYVNSSSAVKAESDICCTSSNAVKVVNALDATRSSLCRTGTLGGTARGSRKRRSSRGTGIVTYMTG
jgi:quinolinate synthase